MRCFNCEKIKDLLPTSKEKLKRCGVCNYKGRLSGCVLKQVGRPYITAKPHSVGNFDLLPKVYIIAQCKMCEARNECQKQFVMSKGSE
jgi:hypothetical protein